ncbi:IQ domain-containing protein K [Megaptera novaeangliae]
MASLLHQAKKEKCFERKRTKFIACDFLTEWLYNQNPKRIGETFTEFFSIPFVEEWLKLHPRPAIPLSLLLTESAAALCIQSFWRAYLAVPDFFLDSLPASCGALAPFRLCSRSQPQSSPWDPTEARASAPSPHPSHRGSRQASQAGSL